MKKKMLFVAVCVLLGVLCACRHEEPIINSPADSSFATAEPTAGTVPVQTEPLNMDNLYIALSPDRNGYLLLSSDNAYLKSYDVKELSQTELMLARNEIYARRGYIFSDGELAEYFASKNWYHPVAGADRFSEDALNVYEKSNLTFLSIYEKRAKGVSFTVDNPYAEYYETDMPYRISTSSEVELVESDYYGMTAEEASLAANEIMARHGYTFTDEYLLEYFLQRDWYLPDTPPGISDSIVLNSVEQENVQKLRAYQKSLEEQTGLPGEYNNRIATTLFSVMTPEYWSEYAVIDAQSNRIRFQEKTSYQAGFGGHVFTLRLFAEGEDFQQFPSFRLLGHLTDTEGSLWYMVVLYPTDVQFDPHGESLYNKMNGEVESVIGTITPAPGCSYDPL